MVRLRWRHTVSALLAMAFALQPSGVADAHDLHTTFTEITVDSSRASLRVMVRAFEDDYAKARAQSGGVGSADSLAYISRSLVITQAGRTLAYRSCGTKRSGDLLWICLESPLPKSLTGLMVRNTMLCELFDDQVNIVRVKVGRVVKSLLFTRGDRPKPLT